MEMKEKEFFFSEVAVKHFLEVNGLTHIIRIHEMVPQEIKVDFKGKVITAFSSYYCNDKNKAGCILVQDGYLTPIQMQTLEKHDKKDGPKGYWLQAWNKSLGLFKFTSWATNKYSLVSLKFDTIFS